MIFIKAINVWLYIYCFSNDKIGDVYKIGFTTREPIIRLNEANSSGTWNISQVTYKFEFAKKVDDCCLIEKNIHDILESFNTRVYPNREFFKLSLTIIKKNLILFMEIGIFLKNVTNITK